MYDGNLLSGVVCFHEMIDSSYWWFSLRELTQQEKTKGNLGAKIPESPKLPTEAADGILRQHAFFFCSFLPYLTGFLTFVDQEGRR